MNLDDFSYTENDRRYINPQVSLAEQNAFINNLRNNQQDWTDETTSVTENLGTKIPSQLGGLTGGSGYFASRYQTPQTNSMVSDLRAAAQSQALSQLMNNEIAKAQKRYNDAYRAAKKRESDANSNGGNGNDLADYLNSLKAVAAPNAAGPLLNTEAIDPNTTDPTELEALIKKAENKLGPLKKLYENTKNKTGIAGKNFWQSFVVPIDQHNLFSAQEERKNRIEALEREISEYRSRL